jgi:MFS family permease
MGGMMKKNLHWYDFIVVPSFSLGLSIASAVLTPLLLPYLVVLFMPADYKNTYLGNIRLVGLAVAMMVQPMAGLLSDRSTSRWGRRRPYIFIGTLFNIIFLGVMGASQLFVDSSADSFFWSIFGVSTSFALLLVGNVILQISSNVAQGASQGLIPDIVPEHQRGLASGVKSVYELIPSLLGLVIGPLVGGGKIWLTFGIIMAGFLVTMLVTVFFVHEEPLKEKATDKIAERMWRLVGLTAIFVLVTQVLQYFVKFSGNWFSAMGMNLNAQVALVGLAGLIAMAGSIFLGVYFGAWVGIGAEARQQKSFIWWVVNRLMFLAAVGSIQAFAQFYLKDVLGFPAAKAASNTGVLMAVVAIFLVISSLAGGALADKLGRKRLIYAASFIAAFGTVLLLFARDMPLVIVSGCFIGLGAGTFMATSWALGTDLAPAKEAGRYLGISNLAGAGAGIVGAGIGGPMADYFNKLQPGLGYLVIFAIYGALFLLAAVTMLRVKIPAKN